MSLRAKSLWYAASYWDETVMERQLSIVNLFSQGIIDWTGTETFAREPKLAKLLRELKWVPVLHNKKVHWFLSHVCNGKFAVFRVLFCGITSE